MTGMEASGGGGGFSPISAPVSAQASGKFQVLADRSHAILAVHRGDAR
jgi:hypothetical protein